MKVLVTGIAGFIGSALAKSLIDEGYDIVGVDNLSTGKLSNIPQNITFIKGDISSKQTIDKLNNHNIKYIFHFAGQSSGEISFDNPVLDLNTNTKSTLLLLDYASKKSVERFFYASSMSVYGNIKEFVNENDDTNPLSFYGVGKLASEKYMKIYSSNNLKCISLRLFNVYGNNQNLDNLKQGMISIYLSMALNDKKIFIKGSKDRFRDFIEIDDVVDCILHLLKMEQNKSFEIYNLCTGVKTKVYEIIKMFNDFFPFNLSIEYGESTPGDQYGIFGDNSKIVKTGWKPKIEFRAGLEKLITRKLNE